MPVIRDDPRASIKTMGEGARIIRERGVSLLLFPEGGARKNRCGRFAKAPPT